MKIFTQIVFVLALFVLRPAGAVVIDISYPGPDTVRAALLGIEDVDDRVYTVLFNPDGTASIRFGDGISGARPSSGGSVIGSYRFGSGGDGKIINEYEIFANKLPFIPIADFWLPGEEQSEASFILAGLGSIRFDFLPQGLQVLEAAAFPAPIPLPPAALLFAAGLLGLFGLVRVNGVDRQRIASG